MLIQAAQTSGKWSQWLSAEQTAYAMGQVTAARALPTLIEFVTITTLLDSRIRMRESSRVETVTNSMSVGKARAAVT